MANRVSQLAKCCFCNVNLRQLSRPTDEREKEMDRGSREGKVGREGQKREGMGGYERRADSRESLAFFLAVIMFDILKIFPVFMHHIVAYF